MSITARGSTQYADIELFREAEDEDDEETREWEEAQVRRAGNMEVERAPVAHKPSYTPANSLSIWTAC